MLVEEKQEVCGCENPYCNLPIEKEKDSEIIENVEQDFPKIAEGCKTKKGEYSV
ncbi:MAG: hypothetical protein ACE5F2_01240 [Candidatus Paceibacteria bacterium]